MEYKASRDTLCKGITLAVVIIELAVIIMLFLQNSNAALNMTRTGVIIFIIPLIFFCYIYAPQSYSLYKDELIINRPVKNKTIKIADITETRLVAPSDFLGTIRTFGVGGLFGYYGKYYNSKLGSMTWYVTQRKNRILIATADGKKIVLSPDDINMVDALQSRIMRA